MAIRETERELKKQISEIEDEFDKYSYLMWLGSKLPGIPESERTEESLSQSCQSRVWMNMGVLEGRLHLEADSDTLIVKGILFMLVALFDGISLKEAAGAEIHLFEELDVESVLNDTRKKGIKGMLAEIKAFARRQQKNFIVVEKDSGAFMQLAGKELRRYLYLLGEGLTEIVTEVPQEGNCMILTCCGSEVWKHFDETLEWPGKNGFGIKSRASAGGNQILFYGEEEQPVLYAVYEFLERQGIRFYLHDDVLPEKRQGNPFLTGISLKQKPLFEIRGIQPFHDFPEGADWWEMDHYKQTMSQLVKMKGNFIGFHNYPENEREPEKMTAEPLVFIGKQEDILDSGDVVCGYPAQHFKTSGDSWGYHSEKIGDYPFKTGQVFGTEVRQPSYQAGYEAGTYQERRRAAQTGEVRESAAKYRDLFQNCGDFFAEVFRYAKKMQIKTCMGTETPLTVPALMKRYHGLPETLTQEDVLEFYKGIFRRIEKKYSLDYYWLWTPEDWTWKGNTPLETQAVVQDVLCAEKACKEISPDVSLALCGWTLGPAKDRLAFHREFPDDMVFSCINRQLGFEPVDPAFQNLGDRPAWAIPWLEDDPALVSPQLWVGRIRKDAGDAMRYGCQGLIGIHWRTETIAPALKALLEAGWNQPWEETRTADVPDGDASGRNRKNEGFLGGVEAADLSGPLSADRFAPCHDFYEDWAIHEFGERVGRKAAVLFERLDGAVPRPARWEDGPGNIFSNPDPWSEVSKQYQFIEELEALEKDVSDPDCRERFLVWLNRWRYLRESARLGCSRAVFDRAVGEGNCEEALTVMEELRENSAAMLKFLLLSTRSTGDTGTLTNLVQRTVNPLYRECRRQLAAMGKECPLWDEPVLEECASLAVLTLRGSICRNEDFTLRLLVPGGGVREAYLYWHVLGSTELHQERLQHTAGWNYEIKIPGPRLFDDFAYHIEVEGEEKKLFYPPKGKYPEKTVIITI